MPSSRAHRSRKTQPDSSSHSLQVFPPRSPSICVAPSVAGDQDELGRACTPQKQKTRHRDQRPAHIGPLAAMAAGSTDSAALLEQPFRNVDEQAAKARKPALAKL